MYFNKKINLLVLIFILAFASNVHASNSNKFIPTYDIFIDSKKLDLSEPPYLQNGTTMVPFRPVFEQLGLTIEWNKQQKQVVGRNSDYVIKFEIGSDSALINGSAVKMPLAPVLQDGITYIPLRFVGTASGGSVELYGGELNVVWILSALQNQLFDAVIEKDVDLTKSLLKAGADPTTNIGPLGTAIFSFADESVDIVALFLEYGMDVNYIDVRSSFPTTLLQNAAGGGHVDVVKFLLFAGADPFLKSNNDWTALEIAQYWQQQVASGYLHIIDPANTPSVETYDEIISLLKE
ncbi:stalk domain-containing protein [Paenibacillus daejeonensis]|uniref:stalk domain-containing protein n=1 Tax=Paenibacillus daejeonensis TaxID=135193 RepID=UPI000361249D|nr:stalk domain-containing protein [Paenibacillus daejeonensis]